MSTCLVAGGAGFIGSKLVRDLLANNKKVIVLDALRYSGRLENLSEVLEHQNMFFVEGSICDLGSVNALIATHRPNAIINLAAETHVDRSIENPSDFIDTNIGGTNTLLLASLDYWRSLNLPLGGSFRYLQVSTDEVYGSINGDPATERAPYRPNSPYAASKAAGDHLVRSYNKTFGLPSLITHGSNTYGPRQFPEKFIPLVILKALSNQPLPIYGDGKQIREWIHVDDHVAGIIAVLEKGEPGSSYNLGSGLEVQNIELAQQMCGILNKNLLKIKGRGLMTKFDFTEDRPGHDRRYIMDSSKAEKVLNWRCNVDFNEGLDGVIDWYVSNRDWWEPILKQEYDLSRLGLLER